MALALRVGKSTTVRPHTRGGRPVRGYVRDQYGLKVEHKPYKCRVCGNVQQIATNHTGPIRAHCPNCSWKGGGYDPSRTDTKNYQGAAVPPTEREHVVDIGEPRRIATTFEVVTPESAAHGEAAEQGWDNEEGESMEPDEYDLEEKISAADKAARWLMDQGATEPSSSYFHPGIWYSSSPEVSDYRTGEERSQAFHLKGFSYEEERMIHEKMTKKSTVNVAGYTRGGRSVRPHIRSHAEGMAFLGKKQSRPYGSNTRIERRGDDVAVKYHATDVVTFHPDETATLRTGGWHTVTTKRRMNQHVPSVGVHQSKHEWYAGGALFEEGMRVHVASGAKSHCGKCGGKMTVPQHKEGSVHEGRVYCHHCAVRGLAGTDDPRASKGVRVMGVDSMLGVLGILLHVDERGEQGVEDVAAHLTSGEIRLLDTGLKSLAAHAVEVGNQKFRQEIFSETGEYNAAARIARQLCDDGDEDGDDGAVRLAVGAFGRPR